MKGIYAILIFFILTGCSDAKDNAIDNPLRINQRRINIIVLVYPMRVTSIRGGRSVVQGWN